MDNCFVKNLKVDFNDGNLVEFGAVRVHLKGNLNQNYRSLGSSAHVVSLISGQLTLKVTGTEDTYQFPATIPANTSLTWITGADGAVVEISDKYSIDNLSVFGMTSKLISTDEFKIYNKSFFNLFNMVQSCAQNIRGRWSDIIDVPTSKPTAIGIDFTPNIIGELKDFAAWGPNCVDISLNGSAITGSIEEYIQALRLTDRTKPASISFTPGGCHVTFNGESVSLGTPGNITWTDNTITYNGVTVNA